jgi:foldase protein PrsA
MKSRGSILALCAFFVAIAVAVSGCGSSIPSGAIASVSGNPISKQAIDHWMYIDEKSQASQSAGEPVIVPNDPPGFATCIAQARAEVPTLKKETTTQVRAACKQFFTTLSGEVMDYLIKAYWYQARAAKLGVAPTAAQVQAKLTAEKKMEFKTPAAFTAYLKASGETTADLLYQTRAELTLKKLEVLAKSEGVAKTALAALKSGKSWGVVAKKYSIDPTTKDKGGLLTDVTAGQQDPALSKAAFAAPLNQLVGPVKGQFGDYVVQVIKITPAKLQSLASVSSTIRTTLTSAKQTAALATVDDQLKKAYGATTLCAKYYSMADCHGYKAPKTATTSTGAATSGAATGGAATTTSPATATATATTSP